MTYTTLVDVQTLASHIDQPSWVLFDCRFSLADPSRGRRDYLSGHIPGAQYLDLNQDLSAPVIPGKTGRHPLPTEQEAAHLFGSRGVSAETQVIAYDDMSGAIAARLWWMLKWLGHDAVAVLDGGWNEWITSDGATRPGAEHRVPADFRARLRPQLVVTTDEIRRRRNRSGFRLLDARAPERYRGETEPIDPVAGHVPGAISAPFRDNLDSQGRVLAGAELRQRLEPLLGSSPASEAVAYCGSGVTAAQDILAFELAGLGRPRLYVGSWSEWITDAENPIAVGDEA
ncbi:MAG: sulfurtransferase [Acidobacteriota bacterium]